MEESKIDEEELNRNSLIDLYPIIYEYESEAKRCFTEAYRGMFTMLDHFDDGARQLAQQIEKGSDTTIALEYLENARKYFRQWEDRLPRLQRDVEAIFRHLSSMVWRCSKE